MIRSKADLRFYMEADRIALGITRKRPRLFGDEIWKFQRLLRLLEFLTNTKRTWVGKAFYCVVKFRFHYVSIRLGFTIPCNVCGPGLSIAHLGTIVINENAKIGNNCRVHVCVNVGTAAGRPAEAPTIGNNIYIGPGVKLFGKIEISDDIAIGANAVVNKSFLTPGITIAGIPARMIGDKGSEGMLIKGSELVGQIK